MFPGIKQFVKNRQCQPEQTVVSESVRHLSRQRVRSFPSLLVGNEGLQNRKQSLRENTQLRTQESQGQIFLFCNLQHRFVSTAAPGYILYIHKKPFEHVQEEVKHS